MPKVSDSNYSDLWHHDMNRDWAGRELDDCPEPAPDDLHRWAEQAARLREEARDRARRGRAASASTMENGVAI